MAHLMLDISRVTLHLYYYVCSALSTDHVSVICLIFYGFVLIRTCGRFTLSLWAVNISTFMGVATLHDRVSLVHGPFQVSTYRRDWSS